MNDRICNIIFVIGLIFALIRMCNNEIEMLKHIEDHEMHFDKPNMGTGIYLHEHEYHNAIDFEFIPVDCETGEEIEI